MRARASQTNLATSAPNGGPACVPALGLDHSATPGNDRQRGMRAHRGMVGRWALGEGLVFAAKGWQACNQGSNRSGGRSTVRTAMWRSKW